jgi:hypothetical protein
MESVGARLQAVCSTEGWVWHSQVEDERWGEEEDVTEDGVGGSGGGFGSSIGVVRWSYGAGGVDGEGVGNINRGIWALVVGVGRLMEVVEQMEKKRWKRWTM